MPLKLVNDFSIFSTYDRIEKIKVSPSVAEYLTSSPSPFIEKLEEFSDGIIGKWDSIPIEVDNVIEKDYKIIWKEN